MLRDTIIEQNNLGLKDSDWNGYDEVEYNFALWIDCNKPYLDRFYVAVFEARRNNLTSYEFFTELFELDQDYKIVWQIDWCEGENDIINIRFYSFKDLMNMALTYEADYITSAGWFNKKTKIGEVNNMKNAELNKYYKELDRKYKELEKKYNDLYNYVSRIRLEVDDLRIDTKILRGEKNEDK